MKWWFWWIVDHHIISSTVVWQTCSSRQSFLQKHFLYGWPMESSSSLTGITIRYRAELQGTQFSLTCFSLRLIGLDLVLRVQWLEMLGSVVCNWKQMSMDFLWNDQDWRLQGVDYRSNFARGMHYLLYAPNRLWHNGKWCSACKSTTRATKVVEWLWGCVSGTLKSTTCAWNWSLHYTLRRDWAH